MGGLGALEFPEVDLTMAVIETEYASADIFELGQSSRVAKEVLLVAVVFVISTLPWTSASQRR